MYARRLVLLPVALVGCSAPADDGPYVLPALQAAHGVPGIAAVLRVDGVEVWASAWGDADPAASTPMGVDTRVRIGSVTKTVTGAAIARLAVEDGLPLHHPVSPWEPAIPGGAEVELGQLLSHTSGLVDYDNHPDYRKARARSWSEDDLLAVSFAEGLQSAPGEEYAYANVGFLLAGRVLEQETGLLWHDALAALVLDPLDVPSIALPDDGAPLAIGHDHAGRPVLDHPHASNGRAATALAGSARDLARLGEGLSTGALGGDAAALQQTPQIAGEVWGYGLGLVVDADSHGPQVGHRGATPGYTAVWRHRPELGATLAIVATSSTLPMGSAEDDVWDELFDLGRLP